MRNEQILNGKWELAAFDSGCGDWQRVESPYPLHAPVPGEVHPALESAGIIDDPFYGTNSEHLQWIEDKEWWYRRSFTLPSGFEKSRTYIEFEGLDTFAAVLLNGEVIGTTENMFIAHSFDVTGRIHHDAENVLEVRLSPTLAASKIDVNQYRYRYGAMRIGARKMQCSFGWDWTPRLIGAGIWRSVRVISYDRLSIGGVRVSSEVKGDSANVWLTTEIENSSGGSVDAVVSVAIAGNGSRETMDVTTTVPVGGKTIDAVLSVPNPKLWWPNGLGEQPMYRAIVSLLCDGAAVDVAEQPFALRKVEIRDRDESGNHAFIFVINDVPVFARGANWIPADHFPSRVTRDKYRELLLLARDAHFNMLRVWGGGIYEDDEFYNLCDEWGIMVWQDFMFSLAEYPESLNFSANVEREVRSVVRRLRNHPSIVMWCGNNECEIDMQPNEAWIGKRYFHEMIPSILDELDGTRPYLPSTPYGGSTANSPDVGTFHGGSWFGTAIGDVRYWRKLIEVENARFVAEFYAQGPPEIETIRRCIPEDKLLPVDGPVWEIHNPNNIYRQNLIGMTSQEALVKFTNDMMGDPQSAEDFATLAGVLQGEFVKAEIDRYRTRKFGTAGALFWMFDDTWPSVSYSLVDYYLRPKPAYYYARRAFAPVLMAFGPDNETVGAWVVNDTVQTISGTAWISTVTFGEADAEFKRVSFEAQPNASQRIWSGIPGDKPEEQVLIGKLEVDGQIISRCNYFFAPFRNINFPDTSLSVQRAYEDNCLILTITTNEYARCVHFEGLPDLARPDDNYFDMFPGESREVIVRRVTAEEAERITVCLVGL
ncbi:MAG: sugar-binding domain-containing protein [Armatimonadota bacterium]|nr:hypothetical protein [bacterium]